MISVIIKHLKNYLEIFITKKATIDYVERKQDEITGVMGALKGYAPRDNKYIEAKNKLLNNVENCYKGREKIIKGFKNGVFPFYYDREREERMEFEEEKEEDELMEMVETEDDNRENDHLVSKYFFVPQLKNLLEYFNQNKNDPEKIIS